jgi:hypothetical protein
MVAKEGTVLRVGGREEREGAEDFLTAGFLVGGREEGEERGREGRSEGGEVEEEGDTSRARGVGQVVSFIHLEPKRAKPSMHLHPLLQSFVHTLVGFTPHVCSKQVLLEQVVYVSF